jgi:hypothetical protein
MAGPGPAGRSTAWATAVRRGQGRTGRHRTGRHRTGRHRAPDRRMAHLTPDRQAPTPHRMAGPCPIPGPGRIAGRPALSTGCRTGAGCRRTRIAFTGRRDPACREGRRGGTTGRVRSPPRTRTLEAGAARARRRACRRPAAPFRVGQFPAAPCLAGQAARFPEGRLMEGRSLTAAREHLRYPGFPGPRGRASTRPPGRASRFPTPASGSARRRNRRDR